MRKNGDLLWLRLEQSPDIAGGVHVGKGDFDVGEGGQDIIFGCASEETETCARMVIGDVLAGRWSRALRCQRSSWMWLHTGCLHCLHDGAATFGELLSSGIYKIKGVGGVLAGRVMRENSVADPSASKDAEHSLLLSLLEFEELDTACL